MHMIKTRFSDQRPGHYSPGIVHNGLLFVSGQLSIDPESGQVPPGGIGPEMRQALKNLEEVLTAAGTSKERVLQVTLYTPDVGLWAQINAIYAEFFGAHKPARSVVPTNALHYGCLVEIDAVAAVE